MDDAEAVAAMRSACPLSLAFLYCLHHDSSSLQLERRDWYISWDWSCWQIQSLTSCYCTGCCRTIIISISCVGVSVNLHWVTGLQMCCSSSCIPSPGICLMLDGSSSQWAQNCSSEFIVVVMASKMAWNIFMFSSIMVPLSMRVWSACLIIALKHELQLLAAFVAVISLISLNVQGIQVIKGPVIEGFPVIRLVGGIKSAMWEHPCSCWAR